MTDEAHIGKELRRRGWRQGSLFSGVGLSVVAHERRDAGTFQAIGSPVDAKTDLVLISQDCDIVASADSEPRLEAYVCKRNSLKFCQSVDRNSARYFLVDPDARLVAHAANKIIVTKRSLIDVTPRPWPSDEGRLQRFIRWLARRYDRFALPDELDEAFRKPLDDILARLQEDDPTLATALSTACHEWRITKPIQEEPPFAIQLSLLLEPRGLSSAADDGIDFVVERLHAVLDRDVIELDPEVRKLTVEQMSLAEFYATVPLFLEPLTYEGDEIIGAPPLPRA